MIYKSLKISEIVVKSQENLDWGWSFCGPSEANSMLGKVKFNSAL